MKKSALSLGLMLFGLGLAPVVATAQQTKTKTTTTSTTSTAERDLRSFSDWVNQKMDRAEAGARRQWPQLAADYDRQIARLDRASDSLSTQSRREYVAQKSRYKAWSAEQQRLDASAGQPATVQSAQRRLLSTDANVSQAGTAELLSLYDRLLETTRTERRQWDAAQWSEASAVLTTLNARYEQIREQYSLEDKLHVRSVQGEFRTLEKAKGVKDYINKS